jgi:pSer/pThr/pTyr-binding forkhead associated (FHA) protein
MQRNMLSDIPTVLHPTVSESPTVLQPAIVETDDLPTHEARTKAYILVEINGRTTVKHWLNRPILTIGRFSTADIQIASPRVSRFHAIIHWKNGAWIIEDTDSLNGLTYQGQRVDQIALADSDCVYLDPTITIQYEESMSRD